MTPNLWGRTYTYTVRRLYSGVDRVHARVRACSRCRAAALSGIDMICTMLLGLFEERLVQEAQRVDDLIYQLYRPRCRPLVVRLDDLSADWRGAQRTWHRRDAKLTMLSPFTRMDAPLFSSRALIFAPLWPMSHPIHLREAANRAVCLAFDQDRPRT